MSFTRDLKREKLKSQGKLHMWKFYNSISKVEIKEDKVKVEPHPNAVKVNEAKQLKIEKIQEQWDLFKSAFSPKKKNTIAKEMGRDKGERLLRRSAWQKKLGLV